jgi:hypothetical protein
VTICAAGAEQFAGYRVVLLLALALSADSRTRPLGAGCAGLQVFVEVERPQRREDVRPRPNRGLVYGPGDGGVGGALRFLGPRRSWCRRRQQSVLGYPRFGSALAQVVELVRQR